MHIDIPIRHHVCMLIYKYVTMYACWYINTSPCIHADIPIRHHVCMLIYKYVTKYACWYTNTHACMLADKYVTIQGILQQHLTTGRNQSLQSNFEQLKSDFWLGPSLKISSSLNWPNRNSFAIYLCSEWTLNVGCEVLVIIFKNKKKTTIIFKLINPDNAVMVAILLRQVVEGR